jgi:hypothetical protein
VSGIFVFCSLFESSLVYPAFPINTFFLVRLSLVRPTFCSAVTDMEGFNSHLNMEQMNKALISLVDMYGRLAHDGTPQPNEPEFRAYQLLTLMAGHGKFRGDNQAFLSTLQTLRPEVRESPAVRWVVGQQRAYAAGNFVKFFAGIREAPYLLACMAHTHFLSVRKRALQALAESLSPSATRPAAVELEWLQELLAMDSLEEARQLCTAHGFACGGEGGVPVAFLIRVSRYFFFLSFFVSFFLSSFLTVLLGLYTCVYLYETFGVAIRALHILSYYAR